jgi:ABC-2 type transport system permease protein
MNAGVWSRAFAGILGREWLRFVRQRARFFASLVRPLLWLVIFAAGFRTAFGLSQLSPYPSPITYEEYIVPGLLGMILLFNGMQAALSMVYDREMGSMKVLLTSPIPRGVLLTARQLATSLVVLPQACAFLAAAWLWGVRPPAMGLLAVLPALVLGGLMLGALGLLLSSVIRQLENFAGVMNFAIFPMFFASTALYPLSRLAETSPALAAIAAVNPFTHAVELIRFALYGQLSLPDLLWVTVALAVFLAAALWCYRPTRPRRLGSPP